MKRKFVFSIFLILLFCLLIQPVMGVEDSVIEGQITDEIGQPLDDVEVGIKKLSGNEFINIYKTTTNDSGKFSFPNLKENNTYLVYFEHNGLTYSKITKPSKESAISFEIKEISENSIIKGKITGIEKSVNIILQKDKNELKSIKTDQNYYKFSNLEKNTSYTIILDLGDFSYKKTVKTDENPLTTQFVSFNFSSKITLNLEKIGDDSLDNYSIELYHKNQLIREEEKSSNKVVFEKLLLNSNHKIVVNYSNTDYIREITTDEENINEQINIYTDDEIIFENINITFKMTGTSSPQIISQERIKIDKNSFLSNNTIIKSTRKYFVVNGEIKYSLPNNEIQNISLLSEQLDEIDYQKNEQKIIITFEDSKIPQDEDVILEFSYEFDENYDGLVSEQVQINRGFSNRIEKISLNFDINKTGKYGIVKSINSNLNYNTTETGFILLNEDLNPVNLEISITWDKISNFQLILYSGIVLALALIIVYSVFIGLIGRGKEKKPPLDTGKGGKEEDEELKNRAAKSAIEKLKERYENDEISKEEYERKKEIYEKMKNK